MSVIVTNASNRIAYNVVRSLGQREIDVYAGDFVSMSMSFASRYSKGHFLYPSPFRNPDAFVKCLLTEADRVHADVLIPVFEETFLIARHKAQLTPHVRVAVPDYDRILIAHNKDRWEPIARRLGIAVPFSCSVEAIKSGATKPRELRYPVLIKPKQGGGSWGIGEAASADVLEKWLEQPNWSDKDWDRFFVQEKVPGHSECVALLFNQGQLRGKVAYRQLRDYPSRGGQATLRVSLRNERAESDFQTLLEELRWHGPCQADFIVDTRDGTPYLIDINPRLWGSLVQAIASGVDFPYLIYCLAKDGDVQPVTSFRTGVVTRWIGGDFAALPSRLRTSRAKLQILGDFFFPRNRASLFDDFSLTDPFPFLTWTLDAAFRAVKFRSTSAVSHDALEGVWE